MTVSKVPTAPLTARSSSNRSRPPRCESPGAAAAETITVPLFKKREKAKSASPRPQHVRPVDAVKLAKGELANKGIGTAVKAGRLRLAALPAAFDDGPLVASALANDADVPMAGPLVHEGFYNLAAGVTKREPTLREKAVALQKHLERGLKRLRQEHAEHQCLDQKMQSPMLALTDDTSASAAHADTFITAHEEQSVSLNPSNLQLMPMEDPGDLKLRHSILTDAELAEKELEISVNVLEGYACETSKESRERNSLLGAAKGTAVAALGKLVGMINRQQVDAERAESNRQELEARLQQLEEENAGLRQMVQHMLSSEVQLQQQNQAQLNELNATVTKLAEADKRNDELTGQLEETYAELLAIEEEKQRVRENVRDGTNSPMMAFSTFVLGPDQVPTAATESKSQQQLTISGDVRKEKLEVNRTDKLNLLASANSRRSASRPSMLAAGLMSPNRSASYQKSVPMSIDAPPTLSLPRISGSDAGSEEESGLSSSAAAALAIRSASKSKKIHSADENEDDSSDDGALPSASPLASAFPALVPYLDFLTADPDADKIKTEGATQSHEHLEKHMVQLQGERKKHMELNQCLQRAVDASLERLLVWVQAVVDSLRDFGPAQTKQDMTALTAVRDMLAWLGKRGCKDWIDPPEQLEQVLASHEERLRAALTAAAESQPSQASKEEVEELRKSLEKQTKHAEELEKRLCEAESRSHTDPESKARRAPSPTGSFRPKNSRESRVGFQTADAPSSRPSVPAGVIAIPERRVDEANSTSSQAERENEPATKDSTGQASNLHDGLEALSEDENPPELEDTSAASTSFSSAAQKMRLYRSPFAQGIDLTLIPASVGTVLHPIPDAQIAAVESAVKDSGKPSDSLGIRQLRSLILEIYATKRLDDQRRDKAHQPRRPLHTVIQEFMRRQHGVKSLVHTKSWQLVQALEQHAPSDVAVCIFADFLDGTRDLDELSFYLYCCSVLVSAVAEESQALPPSKLPAGYVSQSRASRLAEIVFGHLPKAHDAVKAEIEQCIKQPAPLQASMSMSAFQFHEFAFRIDDDGPISRNGCLEVDELCRALLEGWRVCAMLFERSMPNFSWRETVLAFLTTDVRYCGWLDPHEVREAETRVSLPVSSRSSSNELPQVDKTSLGEFVFRAVACTGGLDTAGNSEEDNPSSAALAHREDSSVLRSRRRQLQEACLKIGVAAFTSLERSLGVYLSWLMHSEEPRDLAVYQGVKSRIYGFRCAVAKGECWPVTHNLRCLILLLLGHQFDMQLQRNEAVPDHLAWELTSLLQILRESWRRGANDVDFMDSGPEFGAELDEVGEAVVVAGDAGSSQQSDDGGNH
eukprot:TRINITY_DN23062_c0_g1_i1.p1 TRINITY_DN23062_c0_g1~~TRINITY_DN23062_c0_g1_i1.p1  ORF type:complete len:1333 (+),score=266.53 TRINITY_DN23062_c0_g1_i1:129-4127(+)